MSILKIDDNDILWKYYQKGYTLEDLPVDPPNNFCQYFWGGLSGMLCSLYKEQPLWLIWLLSMSTAAISFAFIYWLFSFPASAITYWSVAPMMAMLFIAFGFNAAAIVESSTRLKWLELLFKYSVFTIALPILGCIFIYAIYTQVMEHGWTITLELIAMVVGSIVLIGFGGLVGSLILVGLLALLVSYVFKPMSTWRFIQSFWLALVSCKKQMCPLIELPESFTADSVIEIEPVVKE